ncbi:cytochrome P450 [Mycena albidolilacea]|uniref:Cytochrome P450 n=1 Tax=Mycena albidolilacea TaxID=1033008 RepID=A0AAD7AHQ2_9AGAR|nr:cytochrome P450 [Mycena albidolilacea]
MFFGGSAMVENLRGIPWLQAGVKPVTIVLVTLWGLNVLRRLFSLVKVARTTSYFPKLYTPFQPFTLPGALFTTSSRIAGRDWHWVRHFRTYSQNETVNVVPLLFGASALWTSNLDIGRQILAGPPRSSFIKAPWSNRAFTTWGMNIVSAEETTWRKHRRVVGPAFGPDLYKLVWNKTLEVYRHMLEIEEWKDKNVVDVPAIQRITYKLSFLLISTCGFGFPSTWLLYIHRDFARRLTQRKDTPPRAVDGGMPAQEALKIVTETALLAMNIPQWLWHLPIPRLREARVARERLRTFMQEQVVERKALVAAGDKRADAFTIMVKANEDESTKYRLDDQELIGNIFVLLFAGHETTGSSLAVTVGYMAIHDDIQEEVVEQIMSVLGPDRDPDFSDYPKLDKVRAIFYEATRMIPAGHALIRQATEDTVLTVQNPMGEEGSQTIHIPKGTEITLDMVGVQYNPRYFEDPEMYNPSRWYGLPADSEKISAFSVGPRACLGRKFATVEVTCFLALLLRDWQVLPVLRVGETKDAWGARVMNDVLVGIALTVPDFPVKLPSQWYGLPADSEKISAFSVGPRACLGRKFATVEATCFLALLLRDWQVLPVLRAGETKEAWGARVMNDVLVGIALSVAEFPVKLVRRRPVYLSSRLDA